MKKILLGIFAICLFISCNKQGNEIRVGVVLPLTGSLSKMGEMERNAMELAAERMLKDSSINIKLYFEDNQSKSSNAVSATNKLFTMNNIDVIITSTTGASLAAQPIIEKRGKYQFAFCMDTDIASISENTIRYYMGLEQEIDAILNHFATLQNKRIAVLCCQIPAYETLVKKFIIPYFDTNRNNSLVYTDYYELNQSDFRNFALQLKNHHIDELILLGYGFEYHNIYKQLIEQDLLGKFTIIGGWGFLYTELDNNLMEGTLVAGPEYVFETSQQIDDFKKAYFDKYGNLPNFDAAFAYELICKIPFLVSHQEQNLKHVLDGICITDSFVGEYTFDSIGNMVMKNVGLGMYKNGEIRKIE